MGIARPTGEYAEQMLDPGGWPESAEDTHYDRAQEYNQVLRQVTDVLDTAQQQKGEVFEGGVWSGSAANAANGALGTNINEMRTLQDYLATVITWHRHIGDLIAQAKSDIGTNVDTAQREICILENDTELDADERAAAIRSLVTETHGANVSVVSSTAEQVLESKSWKPPHNALQDLLDQKSPPPPDIPTVAVRPPGTPDIPVTPRPDTPFIPMPGGPPLPDTPVTPVVPTPANPITPVTPVTPVTPGVPVTPVTPVTPPSGTPVITPVTPVNPSTPVTPSPTTPTAPQVQPTPGPSPQPTPGPSPGGPSTPAQPGTQVPSTPVAPGDQPAAHVKPAAATLADHPTMAGGSQPAAAVGASDDASSSVGMAPAAATGAPTGSARGASGASSGAGPGTGAGQGAGSSPKAGAASRGGAGRAPLGPSSKAASASASPSARAAGLRPTPPARPHASDQPEMPGIDALSQIQVPVSKARAARDAMAAASSARKSDPLRVARRVAAALNAPGMGDGFGFFWITGLTTDGEIVVANSYGLAYIPEGVELPKKVEMASADGAIPAAERARSATYPVMAVQGWAMHHDKKLRAVIGTEEQLANSDPGVAKIVLEPDDIPEEGKMTGRPRLEVVDAEAAAKLADATDARLIGLLPPAPAGDKAPEDNRHMLWFDVMKPMMSNAAGREVAHLRAFHTYVDHCKELALHAAHSAADADAQRPAVADWLYWQSVASLLDSALADAS